ncbi:uncharacterized protein LOC142496790 [Ascaphus truei]|uniref:uncharacterized protein LOC142496790 n=1 Tax=Ascaphus truei TaxID=8439 RepID=UPI003F591645
MYDNYYEGMTTARMEDPRGADSPKWRPEADGESTRGVRPTEEQAVADMSFTSLLWSGAAAVAAPFWSCLGPQGTTLEDSVEDIAVTSGEHSESDCQSAYKQMNATSFIEQTDSATQNGGSRFPGRPRGPSAENSANARLAGSWPGVVPTGKPRPDGGYVAKAAAAPSWTVTHSAPVLGHPINLWDLPLISTRGSGFQLCPVGMNPASQGTGEPTAQLPEVVPAAGVACKKEGYFARKAAERKRLELAAKEEPHPVGDKGAKAVTAATRTERGAALIKGHPIPLWDPPIISTRGSGFQLCPVGMNPAEQGTGEPAAPLQNVIPVIGAACEGKDKETEQIWPGMAPNKEWCSGVGAKPEATPPRTVKSSAPVPGHPINLWDPPQIFSRGRGLYLCQARPELCEGGAGCELPGPQLRGGEQERPLCKVSPVTSTTKSEMDIGVYPYLLPGGSLVVKAGADTAMLTAEAPRAACNEPVDPGEWGSLLMIATEPREKEVYNCGENPEPHRRSPVEVPLLASESASSDEEQASPTSVVMRLPADHYSGAAKEPALTCVAAERSLEVPRSPVRRQPERRSPTAVVTYSAEGGEDSIPSRRSGEIHPYPPQAPVVATVEEGLAQARAERRAEPSLSAADVVVEEEIPLGDPSQDGGVSGSGDDVTSGGGSGTTRERTTTPRRSGSASRSPVTTKSWQAARRAEKGEAQPAVVLAVIRDNPRVENGSEPRGCRLPIPMPNPTP